VRRTDAAVVEGFVPIAMPIHNKTNTNILRQIFLIDTVCASWKDIERERGEVVRFVNGQVFDDNNNFGAMLSSAISNKLKMIFDWGLCAGFHSVLMPLV